VIRHLILKSRNRRNTLRYCALRPARTLRHGDKTLLTLCADGSSLFDERGGLLQREGARDAPIGTSR
jgi:hypothetical protein